MSRYTIFCFTLSILIDLEMTKKIKDMEDKTTQQIDLLKDKDLVMTKTINDMEKEDTELINDLKDKDSVRETLSNQSSYINKATYRSSFAARLKTDVNVKQGEFIKFNLIKTQEGRGYDGVTGVFTAPIRGLYVFHLGILVDTNGESGYLSIMKNRARQLVTTYARTLSGLHYDHGSCSTVTVLEAGDEVAVKPFSPQEPKCLYMIIIILVCSVVISSNLVD